MSDAIRILLLADSHLGFDLPVGARVARRRRGHDFLANYASALAPALAGEVDIVVHGGDVFDRPRVPVSLAYQALDPLVRVADRGVPVFVVPGNHERSIVPHHRFVRHRNVHVFDRPRTVVVEVRGLAIALTGLPFERRDVRTRFLELLERSEWRREHAAFRLLCLHQCVEGATVGPADFKFTTAADVIKVHDVPAEFAAVLSGHIHRHQVLTTDLRRRPLVTPVFYPGSLERTSLAEMDETKGFMILRLAEGKNVEWEFRPLPARPMIVHELNVDGLDSAALEVAVRAVVAAAPPDAVLRIRVAGNMTAPDPRVLSAAHVRTFAPDTMNIEIRAGDGSYHARAALPASGAAPLRRRTAEASPQLDFDGGLRV